MRSGPVGAETIRAARGGDPEAVSELVAGCMPLVYNIVGRALNGHPDVDDVVQDAIVRMLRGLGGLRETDAFRSWLVAIVVRQIRDHLRARGRERERQVPLESAAGSSADFAELTVLRLGLSDERRDVAEATRWLDPAHREVLALWWLEQAGELGRDGLAAALGVPRAAAAVRVQRMRAQLDTGRLVVAMLRSECAELPAVLAGWDGRPGPLWRKRLARHASGCAACGAERRLIPAERLLAGVLLVPLPVELAHPAASAGLTGHVLAGAGTAPLGSAKAAALKAASVKAVAAGSVAAAAAAAVTIVAVGQRSDAEPVAQVRTAVPGPSRAAAEPPAEPELKTVAAAPAAKKKACLKGVSTWRFAATRKALAGSGACWYYTWGPTRLSTPPGVEFVPMIWGAAHIGNTGKVKGRYLLGFNEPDRGDQANMSPEQALELWPRLMRTGMKLGSPAVATGANTPGGWLDRFMRGARSRGYRVDFVTVHWYGSDFRTGPAVAQLRSYLKAVHARYPRKPLWLTEYALMNFGGGARYPSAAKQAAFVKAAGRMLASLPYVQRHAWFALPATPGSGTGLFTPAGKPNRIGAAFKAVPPRR